MANIKDVAAELDLSVATISKALNDYGDISETTRKLVQDTARRMGYLPNSSARSLKTKRTYNLGVLFADEGNSGLTHNYFSRLLDSFRVKAEQFGYDLTFIGHNIGKMDMTYLEHCRHRGVEGVCVACVDFHAAEVAEVMSNGWLPVVAIDMSDAGVTNVASDNRKGMSMLAEHIIKQGHRDIAYIHGQFRMVTRDRLAGLQNTMIKMGIPVKPEYILPSQYQEVELAIERTKQLLALPNPPTCIIYPDDKCAMAAIAFLGLVGYHVPNDISVAGYDGIETSMSIDPFLTTVIQDAEEMGRQAAALLVDRIERPFTTIIEDKVIPGRFEPGKSVGAPPDKKKLFDESLA